MAQAQRRKNTQRKRPKQGASKQQNQGPRMSGGSLFGSGFLLGVIASVAVFMLLQDRGNTETNTGNTPAPSVAEEDSGSSTQFDFFTLLPEQEVIVPEEEAAAANPIEQVSYILQAGSFKRSQDAERRRAELLLLGMEAKVESVRANGDTWHRVYVGPFDRRGEMSSARSRLISEGIDTLLIKRRS